MDVTGSTSAAFVGHLSLLVSIMVKATDSAATLSSPFLETEGTSAQGLEGLS